MILLSPSLLAADCANLESEMKKLEGAVDWWHVDVMDGHFVPNISYGVPVVAAIKRVTRLPLDVHIMITDPIKYVEPFAKAGANILTFHVEANGDHWETIKAIKAFGMKCGISAKPGTPAEDVLPYINDVDMVLQMTVEPGFGGQSMVEAAVEKIAVYRQAAPKIHIQVDGGVKLENAGMLAAQGADVLVAGTAIFGAPNPVNAANEMRETAKRSFCV